MSTSTTTRRPMVHWRFLPVMLMSLATGAGLVLPAAQAAAATVSAAGPAATPAAIAITPASSTGPIVSGVHKTACTDAASAPPGRTAAIRACNGSAEQNWTIEADGTIQASGTCLAIYQNGTANKTPVDAGTCTGSAGQRWKPRNGTLVNPAAGKCLDDPRFNTADGTRLEIYTCNGGASQQWKLP